MSKPSDNSRDHEKDGEHISREAHCFVNDTAVEIDIWIEFSFDEVWIAQGNLL